MAKLLRRIMEKIDERFLSSAKARTITGSNLGLLLICFHPYEGAGAELPDGTLIKPGDPVCELHLSNKRISAYAEDPAIQSVEWQILQDLRKEFAALAQEIAEGIFPADVRGIYGVNVLPAGARRLGFTLIPLPPGWNQVWLAWWESLIRKVYYSFGSGKKANTRKTSVAYEIWMSRGELARKYGKIVEEA